MSQLKKLFVHDTKPVTAGAVLTYNIPSFSTIDDLILRFTNSGAAATQTNIVAAIGKIALNINGEQIINCMLSELYDLFEMLGNQVQETALSNVVSLNLGRLIFKLNADKDYFAWGCQNIQTIQLQVYCNSTVTGVTDLEISTERRSFDSSLSSVIKVINYPQSMSSTGISSVDTLPRDSNDGYLAILANSGTGGAISMGECVVNGNTIVDPTAKATMDYVNQTRGYKPLTNYFNYLFADGSGRGVLPMTGVTELRLKTTFTTAPTTGTYDLLAVSIKNLPQSMLTAVSA